MPCGIHGGMDAVFFAFLKDFDQEINLQHTFSARKSNAAACVVIIGFILDHFRKNFVHGVFSAANFSDMNWTIENAFTAKGAAIGGGTDFCAFSATDAFVFVKHHLRLEVLTFRIVTPRTS